MKMRKHNGCKIRKIRTDTVYEGKRVVRRLKHDENKGYMTLVVKQKKRKVGEEMYENHLR